jgi:hypothetical protein
MRETLGARSDEALADAAKRVATERDEAQAELKRTNDRWWQESRDLSEALKTLNGETHLAAAKHLAAERDRFYKERDEAKRELAEVVDVVRLSRVGAGTQRALDAVKWMAGTCEARWKDGDRFREQRDAARQALAQISQARSADNKRFCAELAQIRDIAGANFGQNTVAAVSALLAEIDPDAFAEATYNECERKIASLGGNMPTLWAQLPTYERNVLRATARAMLQRFVPQARLKPETVTLRGPYVKLDYNSRAAKSSPWSWLFSDDLFPPDGKHDDRVDALALVLGYFGKRQRVETIIIGNPPFKWVAQGRTEPRGEHKDASPKVTLADPPIRHFTLPYSLGLSLKRYEVADLVGRSGVAGAAVVRWCEGLPEAERIAQELNSKGFAIGGYDARIGGGRLNFAVIDWLPGQQAKPPTPTPASPTPVATPERYCVTDFSPEAASVDVTLKQRIARGEAKVVVWYGPGLLSLADAAARNLNRGSAPQYDSRYRNGDVYAVVDTRPRGVAQAPAPASTPAPVFGRFRLFDVTPGGLCGAALRAEVDAGRFKPVAWFDSVLVAVVQLAKLNTKRTRPDDYDPRVGAGEHLAIVDTQPNA